MKKNAGIRFTKDVYVEIDADLDNFNNSVIKSNINDVETTYDLDSTGTGTFELDLRTFPQTMVVGQTYQVPYTLADGCKMRFSASGGYVTISETGLLTAVKVGASRVRAYPDNSNDVNYGNIMLRVDVVAE